MADLFSMKSPLIIRLPDGDVRIMAEYFRHEEGLLFFDIFWNQAPAESIHLVQGEYKGDGPWKVGAAVISVLGCHGCDPGLATQFSEWQMYLQMCADEYPSEQDINDVALSYSALI